MIPLVAGIMTGAMSSGIAISRTGKYRVFPLVGIALMVTALLSMSFLVGPDTSVWTLVPFMVMLGLGLGFNFQPVILAVQNAVSPREMGVATSSVTFFRQMGGTIGTAAFLSILFTRLPQDIGSAVQDTVRANPQLAPSSSSSGRAAEGASTTPPSSRSCRRRWPCRSRWASPTRSAWCSSSRPASWRSGSSCSSSCRSWH
ncbi:MFS transporter [Blastococcus brunescens]|uniref:MFS transporter n=1 Tax=Blastococcus brunescens TaxID=1564165 RepID=A0ABZ1AXG1_9ACTN|nr:MFS transporter [Blastococcus sp. BMG 8361]WRL63247.1 MFS transporter [Blastococcus sp. BMG 8361]